MGSGSPSPTRRMRWEGSKGIVGAGEVHGGLGGEPRFWGAFGFLRLAIVGIPHSSTRVKRFGRDKSNSSPLLHSPQHTDMYLSMCCGGVAAAGSDFAHGKTFGRNDLT